MINRDRDNMTKKLGEEHDQRRIEQMEVVMTKNRIILTKQSGRVTKILTASRILQISIALCQIKAKIHSFPTMYIIGGGKFGLTR